MAASIPNLNNSQFYYRKRFIYQELGEYKKALQYYHLAISIDPLHPEYYFYKGLVNKILGEFNECLSNIQTAQKMFDTAGHSQGSHETQKIIETLPYNIKA